MKIPNRNIKAELEREYQLSDDACQKISFEKLVGFICDFSSKVEDKYGVVPDNNEIMISLPGYNIWLNWQRDLENSNYDKEMGAYLEAHKLEKAKELKRQQKLQSLESKRDITINSRKQRVLKKIEKIVMEPDEFIRLNALNKYLSEISNTHVFSGTVKEKIK